MQPAKVLMLEGGIHNYLEWIKQDGSGEESLWLGKNYVFDARQSLDLGEASEGGTLISSCEGCNASCARYVKCDGFGCHRLIVACQSCSPATPESKSGLYCCEECKEMGEKVHEYIRSEQVSGPGTRRVKRGICRCEQQRRIELGVEHE
jgi:predicted sulfurtransferase